MGHGVSPRSKVVAEPWHNTTLLWDSHSLSTKPVPTYIPGPNYKAPSHTGDQQPHHQISPLPLPLALARILTQALANAAPLAHSKGGLIENLLNYLADKQGDDTGWRQPGSLAQTQRFSPTPGSACLILPSLPSPQNQDKVIRAWQRGSAWASLPPWPLSGAETLRDEDAAQLLSDPRAGRGQHGSRPERSHNNIAEAKTE